MHVLFLALLSVCFVVPTHLVFADVKPADAVIKGALYDIERAEKQVKTLTPSRKANITRLQRTLGLTEERLKTSTHKDDPSWVNASARLTALKQALADLATGKTPGAPTSANAKGAPVSQTTVDPAVAAAQKEFDRIAGEMAKMKTPNKSLVKRYTIQLESARKRLERVKDQKHASWAAASTRYKELRDRLAGMGTSTASKSAVATPQPAQSSAQGDSPTLRRVQGELRMIHAQTKGLRVGQHGSASRFIVDMHRLEQELNKAPDKGSPTWQAAKAQHAGIKTKIVEVMLPDFEKQLQGTISRINKMKPTDFMVPDNVKWANGALTGIFRGIQALNSADSPPVKALLTQLAEEGKKYNAKLQAAKSAQAKLGDVDGRLKEIQQHVRNMKAPKALTYPMTETQAKTFTTTIKNMRAAIKEDLAYLKSIEGKVPMPVERSNMFNFAKNELAFSKPRDLKRVVEQSNHAVDAWVDEAQRAADHLKDTDPKDVNHQANRLLGEGRFEKNLERLTNGLAAINVARVYDTELGRTDVPDRKKQLARLNGEIKSFKAKRQVAMGAKRMPKAASTDPKLLEIAKEVLARPKYGYKHERIVVNYDLKRKTRTEGDIETGAVKSTVTVTKYIWDEFQATTAEKVGDAYYLFVNEFHYYHSAGSTTPTERWILNKRFKSSQIPKENIGK